MTATAESSAPSTTSGTAATKPKHEPINSLITVLSIQGNNLVELSGYMAALWHMRALEDHRLPSRIEDARAAIKKASDAIGAFEATLSEATGGDR